MRSKKIRTIIITVLTVTAAVSAAVLFNRITAYKILPEILLPSYAKPVGRAVTDEKNGYRIIQSGRRITVYRGDDRIWELPVENAAQDFFFEDIDHDGQSELLILCWKRGRFGKHRPTWVKHDELGYSQHIYIYEVEDDLVRPKWMASDIGEDAQAIAFDDGVLLITETDGDVSKWIWNSWGLEKM